MPSYPAEVTTATKRDRARDRSDHGAPDPDADGRFRARRFDADRNDRILNLEEALTSRPTERQLLWIDVAGELRAKEAEALGKSYEFDARTRRTLQARFNGPELALHGEYIHVRVAAEPNDSKPDKSQWLDVIAGNNLVITRHEGSIKFLDDLDDRIKADAPAGLLDAVTFVATLLDSAVTSYLRSVDAIEDEVDALDARSLRVDERRDLLADLVAIRRRIARLRRVLADHRDLFASLASADVSRLTGDADSTDALRAVSTRFESAIAAVEDSRDVLLGSFDVYMTRTAQRTNEVMKILTLATVLLLPGSLVAGLLGMNVSVPLPKDDPVSFWIVVVGVVLFAVSMVMLARRRRWL
jgi:magnesium transporter